MKIFCAEEGDKLKLKFAYDEKIVQIIRSINGREYNPNDRTWTVPNNSTNLNFINSEFEVCV